VGPRGGRDVRAKEGGEWVWVTGIRGCRRWAAAGRPLPRSLARRLPVLQARRRCKVRSSNRCLLLICGQLADALLHSLRCRPLRGRRRRRLRPARRTVSAAPGSARSALGCALSGAALPPPAVRLLLQQVRPPPGPNRRPRAGRSRRIRAPAGPWLRIDRPVAPHRASDRCCAGGFPPLSAASKRRPQCCLRPGPCALVALPPSIVYLFSIQPS